MFDTEYCQVEKVLLSHDPAEKGWEAVFLDGDIDNFILFPEKKIPRDKNHLDFGSMGKSREDQIQLEPISRRR